MSLLITGGSGFIGTNFILDWLGSSDEKVINLDLLTYAAVGNNLDFLIDEPRYFFIQGNIGDISLVSKVLTKYRPRIIVNFAAESHVDRSIRSADDFLKTNVLGTFKFLTAVRNYWNTLDAREKNALRFLHISTDEVYGSLEKEEAPFNESCPYSPNNPYSASKASSDHFVRAFHHTYGLPVLITSCSNNYGPFQFPEKLIPLTIYHALCKKPIPLYGDGSQIRDWLCVSDHCRALKQVLLKGRVGETYHIGGKCELSNIQLVEKICSILDKERPLKNGSSYKSLISFVEDRLGHDWRYAMDTSKVECELGWQVEEGLETGLLKTVRWYLENPLWIERTTKKSIITPRVMQL